jgi:hypothetical protein
MMPMSDRARSSRRHRGPIRPPLEWLFRNRQTGRITVVQFPNLALGLFLATVVVRRILSTGGATGTTIDWISAATLGWWALDEARRGVNPWRRLLGVGAGAVVIVSLLARL